MIPLLIGTLLAVLALGFVLLPLLSERPLEPRAVARARGDDEEPGAERARAVDALREIEFDRETGKLSDSDYASLKSSYTAQALVAMRAESSSAAAAGATAGAVASLDDGVAFDPAEVAVQRWRARAAGCPAHGARPEPDAEFCSDCGRYLAGACAACGAAIAESGARYCSCCGEPLVASAVTVSAAD